MKLLYFSREEQNTRVATLKIEFDDDADEQRFLQKLIFGEAKAQIPDEPVEKPGKMLRERKPWSAEARARAAERMKKRQAAMQEARKAKQVFFSDDEIVSEKVADQKAEQFVAATKIDRIREEVKKKYRGEGVASGL